MKKMIKILYTVLAVGVILVANSCQDRLDEMYANPDATTDAYVEKLFTKMLHHKRVRPEYWEIRTFTLVHTAKYTQTASFINGVNMYQQNLTYTTQRWDDYFTPSGNVADDNSGNGSGIVAHFREIEKVYGTLSDEEKANAEIFYQAAKVFYYDQTAQMVDLWGDLPFSEAGSLNLTGSIERPAFDDADEIYMTIIEDLDEISEYFSQAQLNSVTSTTFSRQDILLFGDIENWWRYTNSLRMRLLMRLSFVNETFAQSNVEAMLNNPTRYPLIDDAAFDVLLHPLTNYTGNLRDAFPEVAGQAAPGYMLEEVMKPANDPRIHVMFDRNTREEEDTVIWNEDYFGMSVNSTSAVQEDSLSKRLYAVIDSATFWFNTNLPGVVFTSSEVHFMKAEAFERWGGGDAQEAYETALKQSVDFYYNLNSNSSTAGREELVPPTEVEKDDFVSEAAVAYEGTSEEKLAKIWTQKWLHFGWQQSVQAWSELRRTKYPQLTFQTDNSTPLESLPPSRLVYPDKEANLNAANYQKVASKDTPGTKIFWDVK